MESNTTSPAETLKVAVAAYNDGNLFEAEHLCHAILAASPAFVEALSLLANIQARLGHGNDALATYEQVLAIRADDAVVFNNRGVLLQEMKRFDEALASYEKAIALKPDLWMPYTTAASTGPLQAHNAAESVCAQDVLLSDRQQSAILR